MSCIICISTNCINNKNNMGSGRGQDTHGALNFTSNMNATYVPRETWTTNFSVCTSHCEPSYVLSISKKSIDVS